LVTGPGIQFSPGGAGVLRRAVYERSGGDLDIVRIGDLGGNGRIERHVIGTTRAAHVANNDIYLSGTVTSGVVENYGNVFVTGETPFSSPRVPPTMPGVLSSREGIDNHGAMTLVNSLVSSDSHFANHSQLTGSGTLLGNGRFLNHAAFSQVGGDLVLAMTGANENRGNMDLAAGFRVTLQGADLSNGGSIRLNNGQFDGNGTLINAAGGAVSGRGAIRSDFANAGTLIVSDGALAITRGFRNDGLVSVLGGTGVLNGGTVDNRGVVSGAGQIGSRLDNASTGRVTATAGVLSLANLGSNAGQIGATTGATLLVVDGLERNAGTIALQGGIVDNNARLLTNTGRISGAGILRTDRLVNQGQMQFTAGLSEVYGEVDVAAGARVILSGRSTATFYDDFTLFGGGELRVASGSAGVFFGAVNLHSGSILTGTGDKYFEGGLAIGSSPGYVSTSGNVSFGTGNVFTAEIGGLRRGVDYDAFDVGGTLTLGGTLRLVSWDGFVGRVGDVFDLFNWGTLSGEFHGIDATGFAIMAGAGLDFSQLHVDGTVRVVPVPAAAWLLVSGLAGLAGLSRRRRGSRVS